MEFDQNIVIEAGGAMYVQNEDATINIGRSGGSGSITVQAGGTLGALTSQAVTVNFNNPSSALIFESGANFVENGSAWTFSGTASPLPKPEFRFAIEGQASNTPHWHQFALPFDLTATTDLSAAIPINTTSGQENLFKWNDGQNPGLSTEYIGWEAYTGATLGKNEIYTFYAGGPNYPYSGNSYITLSDDIDWADRNSSYQTSYDQVTKVLYNPGTFVSGNGNDGGWTAIYNPYPAHLKVSEILTELDNKTFNYKAVHLWDPSQDQYIAYVEAVNGSTIISSTDGGNASAGTYDPLVPPGRFFWVKDGNTKTVTITESMKAEPGDFSASNFLHGLKNQSDILKIELSGFASPSYITYIDRAGFAADTVGSSDAFALRSYNPDVPRFYEVLPDAYDSELCINSLDISQFGSRTVAVETNQSLNLSISLDTSTLSGLSHLYLLDQKLNITTDLLQSSYAFTHNANDVANRFTLSLDLSGIGVEEVEAFSVGAYFAEDQLRLKFSEDGRYDLHVYNLTGVQVYETALEISGNVDWSQTLNLPAGIYVVQINNAYGQPVHTQKLMK